MISSCPQQEDLRILISPEQKARMSSQQWPSTQHGTNRHKANDGKQIKRKLDESVVSPGPSGPMCPREKEKNRKGRKKDGKTNRQTDRKKDILSKVLRDEQYNNGMCIVKRPSIIEIGLRIILLYGP
jgi:hypothetical protein